ncbi:TPA: hypothetical protein ACXI3L_004431 [Serratia marcescens]|uniref:hypothetical protein n=1 Tax=Serratia marcescens TaxID=615 RepID=UPI0012B64E7C|nr:hypothetical protein [Serratia marcescens]
MQNLILSLRPAGNSEKSQGAQRWKRTKSCLAHLLAMAGGVFTPLYARARARLGRRYFRSCAKHCFTRVQICTLATRQAVDHKTDAKKIASIQAEG